ncbi:MAG: ABC transporter substrate-binding protein, partial [Chloroflexi bacterium]|nr:ABC transporter substrate-binding protein [Chloroflexota bacterium]
MPSGRIRRFTWIVANTTLALVVLAACGGGQAPAATSAPAKAGSAPASGAPAESKPAAPTESKPAVSAQSSPTAAAANPTAAAVKPPAAPAKPAPSGPPIKLRIATPSNSMLFLQPILADRLGYFKEAGLDVELNIMSSAGNAQAALISGSVDIASLSPDDVVNVISKGQQLLVFEVNFLPYAGEMPLRKDTLAKLNVSPTAPVEDRFKALKGLKIGVTGTTSLHNQALTASLRSVGLDPQKDVDVIGTGSIEAMIASLERGHIDAYVVAPPNSTISVARGHAVMFLSGFKNEFPAMRNVIMEAAFAR